MRSYSVRKLVPLMVLSFRIVTKCRVTVYVLNIFVGNLSPAFRKIIRLEKNPVWMFFLVFPGFRIPEGSSMFVLECLEFVTPSRCVGCPAWELGLFMLGPGKSYSSAVIYFTDEVLNFFSVLTFTFECSWLTVPSWHGFFLSEWLEHGLLRGREDAWITALSGRSFDRMFAFECSWLTVPSWHSFFLSEWW